MDGFVTNMMAQFFSDNPPKVFKPCAYYDKHLDCIRVQVKDCSFTEFRLNSRFTICQANHVKKVEYVGFGIKGIRHFFEKVELPRAKEGPYILAEIMDAIVKDDPDAFSDLIQSEFADKLNLEVEDFQYADMALNCA